MEKILENNNGTEIDSMEKLMSVLNHKYLPQNSLINPNTHKMIPFYEDPRKANFLVRPPMYNVTQPNLLTQSEDIVTKNTNKINLSNTSEKSLSEKSEEILPAEQNSKPEFEKSQSTDRVESDSMNNNFKPKKNNKDNIKKKVVKKKEWDTSESSYSLSQQGNRFKIKSFAKNNILIDDQLKNSEVFNMMDDNNFSR